MGIKMKKNCSSVKTGLQFFLDVMYAAERNPVTKAAAGWILFNRYVPDFYWQSKASA